MELPYFSIFRSPCFPVVLLMFMQCFCLVGLLKSMGVLFSDLSKSIPMDSTDLGITLGLLYAVGIFTIPTVAALGRISHNRLFLVIVATTENIAIMFTFYATSRIHMFTAFTIYGMGNSILQIMCGSELDRLAGENFNFMYSLSTCGYSFGMGILPFLAEELLVAYGWRGVLLIIGCLFLNSVPCAMIIRWRIPEHLKSTNDVDSHESKLLDKETSYDTVKNIDNSTLCSPSTEHTKNKLSAFFGKLSQRICSFLKVPKGVLPWFRSTYLHADPFCSCIFLSDTILHIMYAGWHIFLVPHAFQRGISPRNTIIITVVASLGNLLIRPVVAVTTHRLIAPITMYLVLTVFNILSLMSDIFLPNFYVMLITSVCSAACIAGRAVLAPLIIRGRVPTQSFPMALCLDYVLADCGVLLGGYLSGLVADNFSSYDATFMLLVAVDVFTFISMLIPNIKKKNNPS